VYRPPDRVLSTAVVRGIPDLPFAETTAGTKDLVIRTGQLSRAWISADDNRHADIVAGKYRGDLTTEYVGERNGRRQLGRGANDIAERAGSDSRIRRPLALLGMPRVALVVPVREASDRLDYWAGT
jgi:hypothetical protein